MVELQERHGYKQYFCHVKIINDLQEVFRSLDCRLVMARDCRPDANNPKRVDTKFVELHTFGDELKVPCLGSRKICVFCMCFLFRLLVKAVKL